MNLQAAMQLFGFGTSEGVSKEWDTRGRGKKPYVKPTETERVARTYDVTEDDLGKVNETLAKEGFTWAGTSGSMDEPGSKRQGLSYEPYTRMQWNHPDGHTATLEATMHLNRKGDQYEPTNSTAKLHLTAPKDMHDRVNGKLQPYFKLDSAGQSDSSSFIGRKYTVVDTKYGHYISEHDNPDEAENAARARPYSKVVSQPRPENTPAVRDMARQRLVKTNPDVDG